MFNSTKRFYKFLNKCKCCGIRLKSVKYDYELSEFVYHFCKVQFSGNNTYFYDDDYWIRVSEATIVDLDDLYNAVIDGVCGRYGLKKD